ncbi:MAG: thioredoxin-dependent thiol peroxidase [Verrucomicrobiales bacterium]|nr:thioredoxin-dependent thiol peroxidase [Verrucomicrobiales bacterium]MDB6130406.1 thioredoxin-dependent thiol peroxidase [Verrucomicrobiales bacterium]
MSDLVEGTLAPDFCAADQEGNVVCLHDLIGSYVVLYFYPRDNTPGCTQQACAYRDNQQALKSAGVVVLGVSTDNVASHAKFVQKQNLNFKIIADPDKRIVSAYGVYGSKTFMGRLFLGTHRTTFLIDKKGKISKIWKKVKPKEDVVNILKAVNEAEMSGT